MKTRGPTWVAGGSNGSGATPQISAATSAAALLGTTSAAARAELDPAIAPMTRESLAQLGLLQHLSIDHNEQYHICLLPSTSGCCLQRHNAHDQCSPIHNDNSNAEAEPDLKVMQTEAGALQELSQGCCRPASLGWAAPWAAQSPSVSLCSAHSERRPACPTALLHAQPSSAGLMEQELP